MPQEEQAHRGDPPLAVFPGSPLVPAPALEAGTLPMALGLALGTLLLVTSLVLGAQWFRGRGACSGRWAWWVGGGVGLALVPGVGRLGGALRA